MPDPVARFAEYRAQLANPPAESRLKPGEHCLGVVTPGRLMMVPAGSPGSMPANLRELATQLAPPLNVTAIGFTELKAVQANMAKALPHLIPLVALAHIGHSVVVFEGNLDAFKGALESADLLIVDSGMTPFLDPQ